MYNIKIFLAMFIATFIMATGTLNAQSKGQLHPINKKLVQLGLMPIPKYYPEVPRITAHQAYSLYSSGKALFVLISYSDKHLIVGGFHLTEDKPPKINPNRLPFKPGQVLVTY